MQICFVSPYPPRSDGISEFNQDLINSLKLNQFPIVYSGLAINEDDQRHTYSSYVKRQIRKNVLEDYVKAAQYINDSTVNLVVLQLEYSLFGGYDGAYIKAFIQTLRKKIVVVVHGMPINSYSRRQVTRENFFKEIAADVDGFIVINPLQKDVLRTWGVRTRTVQIFHGAPDAIRDYNKIQSRQRLGLNNDLLIFNFGLFHGKKGLEYLLPGFKRFVSNYHSAHLIIAGTMLKTSNHQDYLQAMKDYVRSHSLQKSVTIINKFFPRPELYTYLASADIVVYPYTKRDLVSSGPLSFSVQANNFIVTTPFPYAKALLDPSTAHFVNYEDSADITKAFRFYTENRFTEVQKMKGRLSLIADRTRWSEIAKEYYHFFKSIA